MSWTALLLISAGCYLMKAFGPLVLADRSLPPTAARLVGLQAVPVLAALVVIQTVSSGDRLVLDARLPALAEDLRENGFADLAVAGEPQHLDDDFVLRFGTLGSGVSDRDRISEDGAVDSDKAAAGLLKVGSDERVGFALQDLNHETSQFAISAV